MIKLPADIDSPAYQVEVIVDPASGDAQKIAPILMVSFYLPCYKVTFIEERGICILIVDK